MYFPCFELRCLDSFPSSGTDCVRFNRQGTRLLCRDLSKFPVVYTVPERSDGWVKSKVTFSAPDYGIPYYGKNVHCFAGQDDKLVVATSDDHGLFVWPLPSHHQFADDKIVDQSLIVLRGHKDKIKCVCYNHRNDTLASAGNEKTIKLWAPFC